MSEAQDTFFSSPKNLIVTVVAAFAVPIIVIALLINYANNANRTGAGTDSMSDAAISQRLAPVATVEVRDANAPRVYKTGEEVFKAVCFACHATGTAGAPKFGNAADWAPRISQGYDTLVKTALTGMNAMPPRGGTSPDDYSDYEIARAVVYMANAGGAHFADPPAPAPVVAASGTTTAAAPAAAGAAPLVSASAPAAAPAMAAAPPASQAPATTVAAVPAQPPAAGAAAQGEAPAGPAVGKALYEKVCFACHATGVSGAPKFGNKADWAPRLKDPMDTVYNYALHGKGVMPPKGGSNASDADVKAAVDYMVNAAK